MSLNNIFDLIFRRGKPAASLGPSLVELLHRGNLKLVDVGARGGARSPLNLLAPFAHFYACEPEPEAAEKVAARLKQSAPWREVSVFTDALASKEGDTTLYVTQRPGLSSLLLPNEPVVTRYYSGGEFSVAKTVSVRTITLDRAAERYHFRDACFVKLDTQGTELDILQSGERLLRESMIGIYVEVEFQPLYLGQPLFAEVDAYLRSLGFALYDLNRALVRRAAHPADSYSRRQVLWAHALYLKEPETILALNDERILPAISQLLALALAFEHYDLAFELVTAEHSQQILREAGLSRVSEELENYVQQRTGEIRRWTGRKGIEGSALTAFHYTDAKHIYG
jgi:FkbM family methyltransferase